jgi:transposase-like protein
MSDAKATDKYAGMRTRRHWKREEAARALADWAESGESLTAFARRNQLGLHRLQWWRAQLSPQTAAEQESMRLVPVVPRQAPLIALGAGAVVSVVSVTVGAARIDVSDIGQTDPRWLAALVAELQGGQS